MRADSEASARLDSRPVRGERNSSCLGGSLFRMLGGSLSLVAGSTPTPAADENVRQSMRADCTSANLGNATSA
jgi:hypothetical protein